MNKEHLSFQEKRDILQPYKYVKGASMNHVNEDYIKVYGPESHPDPEVRDYYLKKQGLSGMVKLQAEADRLKLEKEE